MSKKNIYLILGILGGILVILWIANSLLQPKSTTSSNIQPTDVFVSPTTIMSRLPPQVTETPKDYSFLQLNYPLTYEDIVIDFSVGQNRMDVYYEADRAGAVRSLKKFFGQYGFDDPIQTNLKIYLESRERVQKPMPNQ